MRSAAAARLARDSTLARRGSAASSGQKGGLSALPWSHVSAVLDQASQRSMSALRSSQGTFIGSSRRSLTMLSGGAATLSSKTSAPNLPSPAATMSRGWAHSHSRPLKVTMRRQSRLAYSGSACAGLVGAQSMMRWWSVKRTSMCSSLRATGSPPSPSPGPSS